MKTKHMCRLADYKIMFMNKTFVLLVLAQLFIPLNAQTLSREYGKVGQSDIELKEYALDKEAAAVVLFDIGKSYFVEANNGFEVVFERETRIKVFSDAGVKWANVEIPFYGADNTYEKVSDIEAVSYNFENGRLIKTPHDVSKIFEEKVNKYWTMKKIAIPNVKAGSVIEYRYKINSQSMFNFRDWEFQWRIPVVYSEYITRMIPFYEYVYILQGASKFDEFESYVDKGLARNFGARAGYGVTGVNDMVYKFVMKDVPAFGDEEFISSINDYIIKLDFQLSKVHRMDGSKTEIMSTWDELIKELLKHEDFGKWITRATNVSKKIPEMQKIMQSPLTERFNLVVDYMKANYNWDGFHSKYASKSPNKLLSDKTGNSADLNLLCLSLLNAAGVEAAPVIISTRNNGKIHYDYPFVHFFNYVVILANVGGKLQLTDATEVMSLNNRVPKKCINDRGLIVKAGKVEWIEMDAKFVTSTTTFMQMSVTDKNIGVDILKNATEYDALNFRNNYGDKTDNIKQKLANSLYDLDEASIKIDNYSDKTKPYRMRYRVELKPELHNNKIYVSPFLNEIIKDNPLKQNERKYPIDMVYPERRSFRTTLSLPNAYTIEHLPEDINISNEQIEIMYSIKKISDDLLINFDYFFKKAIYNSDEYATIKQYFEDIIKKGNEKIVLVKQE